MPIVLAYTPSGYGEYIEGVGTLKANGGDCGGGSEVLIVLESSQNHAQAKETEICPALPASMGMGGGYVPMIVEPIVLRDDITIKVDGGALPLPSTQCTGSKR